MARANRVIPQSVETGHRAGVINTENVRSATINTGHQYSRAKRPILHLVIE